MNNRCILLIDDEEAIREVVQIGIEIEVGWEVLTASSGMKGIALAQTHQPDVILLDVMMPDMDGITTLANLKSNPRTKSIPVIFLTAKTQTTDKKEFQDLSVAGIITKPFSSITLADKIAIMLNW